MVSNQSVQAQLKEIGFNTNRWNRAECLELAAIILPDEKIFECVNGWYEGGVALLCATDIRILLVDKKPLRFLTVEDLRFDTINQIDYSHRLIDAHVNISAGLMSLTFRSYNKDRLRKLIGHVQHRMAELRTQASDIINNQKDQIDQQLQTYVMAQYQQHESMRRKADSPQVASVTTTDKVPIISDKAQKFDNPLEGFNYHGSLATGGRSSTLIESSIFDTVGVSREELYNEGMKEISAKRQQLAASRPKVGISADVALPTVSFADSGHEINPLRIAYSQLVNLIANRKYSGSIHIQPQKTPVAID
ncbi:MAG TPA: PH domain-containing protein [Candidatus Saccharimonadales bacterium]